MESDLVKTDENDGSYIRIRRTPFFVCLALLLVLPFVLWFWNHLSYALSNWPPHAGTHKAYIKSLGCDQKILAPYIVTDEELHGKSREHGYHPVGYDRKLFFEKPACVGAIVFWGEYGGPKQHIGFYDMTTKERTIDVSIVHVYDANKVVQSK